MPPQSERQRESLLEASVLAVIAAAAIAFVGFFYDRYILGPDRLSRWVAVMLIFIGVCTFVSIGLYFLNRVFDIKASTVRALVRGSLARGVRREYSRLVQQWMKFIQHGPDSHIWRIRSALAKEYIAQEMRDLSGAGDLDNRRWTPERLATHAPEGRPLVITSFVRYSQMVKALVSAAADTTRHKRSTIVCVTTLSISLEKWFNFDDRYGCINPDWDAYLSFLQSEVNRAPTTKTIIARVLLVKEPTARDSRDLLRAEDKVRADLKKWIWVTLEEDNPDSTSQKSPELKAVAFSERATILEKVKALPGVNGGSVDRLAQATLEDNKSYVILPRDAFPECPPVHHKGRFSSLGDEFIRCFHTERPDGEHHAYYAFVDPEKKFVSTWDHNTASVPVDIFYVGLLESDGEVGEDLCKMSDRITPLFCLGARPPDQHVQTIYLYLLDLYRCPAHFEGVRKYVTELLGRARPLRELMQ
jgi:hypothetical protein